MIVSPLTDANHVRRWAERFALLSDPSRLTLLLTIRCHGSVCVSDLAAVTGLKPTTVSAALRLLRANELVRASATGT
jgi:DNA-binding transcriptional ArsR family regulator